MSLTFPGWLLAIGWGACGIDVKVSPVASGWKQLFCPGLRAILAFKHTELVLQPRVLALSLMPLTSWSHSLCCC